MSVPEYAKFVRAVIEHHVSYQSGKIDIVRSDCQKHQIQTASRVALVCLVEKLGQRDHLPVYPSRARRVASAKIAVHLSGFLLAKHSCLDRRAGASKRNIRHRNLWILIASASATRT